MSLISCKTCKRSACGYAGIKTRKRKAELEERAATCQIGHKAGPGKPNPPGHGVTEKAMFDDFQPPSDKELTKAAKQGAYLKRGRV